MTIGYTFVNTFSIVPTLERGNYFCVGTIFIEAYSILVKLN